MVAFVDIVANRLAHEVIGNRVTLQAVVSEELPLFLDVFGVDRIDVEVVAPAGELKAVIAHFFGQWGEFFERKIGPLAGEQCDRT